MERAFERHNTVAFSPLRRRARRARASAPPRPPRIRCCRRRPPAGRRARRDARRAGPGTVVMRFEQWRAAFRPRRLAERATIPGCAWPRAFTAIPPSMSRYSRPLSSKRRQPEPATTRRGALAYVGRMPLLEEERPVHRRHAHPSIPVIRPPWLRTAESAARSTRVPHAAPGLGRGVAGVAGAAARAAAAEAVGAPRAAAFRRGQKSREAGGVRPEDAHLRDARAERDAAGLELRDHPSRAIPARRDSASRTA